MLNSLHALACDPPEKHDRPISHWAPRELADELIKQKIVKSISPRHVGRLLAEADLKPYQSGYWLHPRRYSAIANLSKAMRSPIIFMMGITFRLVDILRSPL
jgi:hypothetical protein